MKLRFTFFLIFSFLAISACSDKDEIKVETLVEENSELDMRYNNPSIFLGSSFGEYFRACHLIGHYEEMYRFTATESIDKYEKEQIMLFYNNIQLSYKLDLKTITKQGDYYILFYRTNTNATKRTLKMKVILENDSTKIVWDTLNINEPFIGL